MDFSKEMFEILTEFGVGKRTPQDKFFKTSELLSDMSQCLSVFDINLGKYSHSSGSFKCHVPGCAEEFEHLVDYESHYNTAHKFTCCECKKNLPSSYFLDLHVAEEHDSFFAAMAERGPAYMCYLESCKSKFLNPEERMKHCVTEHKFPPNFRFDRKPHTANKPKRKNRKNKNRSGETPMETGSDVLETDTASSTTSCNIKPATMFEFCPSRPKTFQSSDKNKYKGKKFHQKAHPKPPNTKSKLEDENMLFELKESLPE